MLPAKMVAKEEKVLLWNTHYLNMRTLDYLTCFWDASSTWQMGHFFSSLFKELKFESRSGEARPWSFRGREENGNLCWVVGDTYWARKSLNTDRVNSISESWTLFWIKFCCCLQIEKVSRGSYFFLIYKVQWKHDQKFRERRQSGFWQGNQC